MVTRIVNNADDSIVARIGALSKLFATFLDFVRKKADLLQVVSRQLFLWLSQLNIEDAPTELFASNIAREVVGALEACQAMKVQHNLSSHFLHNLPAMIDSIRTLSSFLDCFFCTKFEIVYSLANFTAPTSAETLMKFCYRFDNLPLARRFSRCWNLGSGVYDDEYALTAFSLGIDNNFNEDRREHYSQRTLAIVDRHVQLLTHESFVDPFLLRSLTDEALPSLHAEFAALASGADSYESAFRRAELTVPRAEQLRRSRSNAGGHDALSPELGRSQSLTAIAHTPDRSYDVSRAPHFIWRLRAISAQLITQLDRHEISPFLVRYLKAKAPITERVRFFASYGFFDRALKYFKGVAGAQNRWNAFRDGILQPSISYNSLPRLRSRILAQNEIGTIGGYLEKLLHVSVEKRANALRFELEMFLGRFDCAVLTATGVSLSGRSIHFSLRYVHFAQRAAELATREGLGDSHKIRSYAMLLDLQRRYYQGCIDGAVKDSQTLDLFSGHERAERMIAVLFRSLQVELGINILLQCQLSPANVSIVLADSLVGASNEEVFAFVHGFEAEAPLEIFRIVMHRVIRRLLTVHHCYPRVLEFVRKAISDLEFKCLLLFELGQIEDAFSLARKERIYSVLGLIGNMGHRMGILSMANDAQKELCRQRQ
jgi:hypothetical protein